MQHAPVKRSSVEFVRPFLVAPWKFFPNTTGEDAPAPAESVQALRWL
ncbi:MAG TPA: hypothetical protein VD973_06465 [Symbiobacteriaceae bacterium]|nr:hypothetical protein [Symbiobacteriaceae bacterium]